MATLTKQENCRNSFLLLLALLLLSFNSFSQKNTEDSILQRLKAEKADSNRVKLLCELAAQIYFYSPDSALIFSRQALELARNIKYTRGESRALDIVAKAYSVIGSYSKALDMHIQRLKIEERDTSSDKTKLASVLMSIGNDYIFQDEYRKALEYYYKSDSIIQKEGLKHLRYYSYINIGDAYDKLNILDSAFLFYRNSEREADLIQDKNLIGASKTGLGHIYRKQSNFLLSLDSYKSAIVNLKSANNDDLLCEAHLGLAMLYNLFSNTDSAISHSKTAFTIAKKDGFLSRQFDAAKFLTQVYTQNKNIDSAFAYLTLEKKLNDTLNSKERIRESQILSSNELSRQIDLAETKKAEEKQRRGRLQLLLIGIFIPGFFLITLFLSRVKLHIRAIKLLGILSLLFFFEYLTLLLHPTVARMTNHTPVLEILVFVCVAAILIPLHHKAEHWLIHKLLHHRIRHADHDSNKGT